MKSPKVKTQKTFSAILGLALAGVILFQSGKVQSMEPVKPITSVEEASILAEIELIFLKEGPNYKQEIFFEELQGNVKVYNSGNVLLAEGNTSDNETLRRLVNTSNFLSESHGTKYFRIAE